MPIKLAAHMVTQHQSLNISKRKEHKEDTCITKHKQGA